ncbi:hypothetical protein CYG49_00990 [Candidatus Saccharibacteria bacterium]|nr:MAG: hypothetical protein CYG49_00990 [Candidatus Saccharibacteria bacterium]
MTDQTLHRTHITLHLHRIFWFSFLLVGLLLIQSLQHLPLTRSAAAPQVLAYMNGPSRTELHSLTNQNRANAGLAGLALNSQLNQAAQAKAEHMIANNYWSHTAPDGTTPWYFIDQSGYGYINAGENLAYGFTSNDGVLQGWMNSTGHRANIMGDYKDVGFGYANGANYQGGENTVVVAMYGTSTNPAPAPTSPAPSPTSAVESAMQVPQAPAPAAPTPPAPSPAAAPTPVQPTTPVSQAAQPSEMSAKPEPSLNTADQETRTRTADQLFSGVAAWYMYATASLIGIASIGFTVTHIRLLHYGWNNGVHFVLAHPLIDAAVLGSIALTFMSATIGLVR